MTEYAAGSESRVNSYSSAKFGTFVAALPSGGYVVTWSSDAQDGDGPGVFAQRYDGAGVKLGGEFQVNSNTLSAQFAGGVTALADGGFIIIWESNGQDGSQFGIYSQRFNAFGEAVGGEQRVNTYTAGNQITPDIAALSNGGYVVSWTVANKDGSDWDIYSQLYSASGSPLGTEQRVNSTLDGVQTYPWVSGLAEGGYVVVWGSTNGGYGQRFDASGQRLGVEFRIGDGSPADVAELEGGGFVVTSLHGGDGSGLGIYARRYNAEGQAMGPEVQVNTGTTGDQADPSVAALADGGFVVTWQDQAGGQFDNGGIFAQVFDSFGAKVGGQQQVSATTDRDYYNPSVTTLQDGNFVVSWLYSGSQHPQGIFARAFSPVASIIGDSGSNSLAGTSTADTINGEAGIDQIAGFSGDDFLAGGAGPDKLFGGDGNDTISSDRAIGFDGNTDVDMIFGGAGNDMIFAGYGDIVDGGEGFDTLNLSYVGASHGITGDTKVLFAGQPLTPGGGTVRNIERFDAVALTNFHDVMVIGDQADPATAYGYDGDDHLIGQENRVVLHGGNGNDLIVGSTANDVLYGDNGNDILIGGPGMDELWGGAGNDRFLFTHTGATDTIGDFLSGVDAIDLTGIDADTSAEGNQAFSFIGSAAFSGKAGELRVYNGGSVGNVVAVDVNGDSVADLMINLGSAQAVSGDFLL
jgi:hypothetical protein